MRTEQDKVNRREANRRYYQLEENKEQKRNYMKEYAKRPEVKERAKKYYTNNKLKWGGKRTPITTYPHHEQWAKKNGYRETSNEHLNVENTEIFIKNGQR